MLNQESLAVEGKVELKTSTQFLQRMGWDRKQCSSACSIILSETHLRDQVHCARG
jgi:hypothetical protein